MGCIVSTSNQSINLASYQERVPTCVHSWRLYSAPPFGNQAASTMTWYPTQSHYPVTEPTSPCPILLMPSTKLGSNKYHFCKSLVWHDWESNSRSPAGVFIPPRPFFTLGWLVFYMFTSWQHRRSYQDGYLLVTVCTHDAVPQGDQATSIMT